MKHKYNYNILNSICKESKSYAEVLTKLNITPVGGNYKTLKNNIRKYNVNISHFTHQGWNKGKTSYTDSRIKSNRNAHTYQDIFIENSFVSQKTLRNYVKNHNIIEYKCAMCGNDGHWLNKIISLELDHIDGNNSNNLIDNLRYLCPNCHATTLTYRGKNKKT